jgi:periplasmic divalent cation tolerance protein
MPHDILVCLCTCPDSRSAAALATALVEASLAACVNQLPGAVSVYRWEGRVHSENEVLLVIKTTTGRFAAMRERLLALHPYDVPELLAWPMADGHVPYLDWVRASVAGESADPAS